MPTRTLLFAICFFLAAASSGQTPASLSVARKRIANIPVTFVVVSLRGSDFQIRPAIAQNRIGTSAPLTSIARQSNAQIAVTGAFFDTRTLKPVGDIVIDRRLRHFGGKGAALCLTRTARGTTAVFRDGAGVSRRTNWRRYEHVLGGGMWLVRNTRIALNPKRQGFRDRGLYRAAARTAVALLPGNRLLLAATSAPVTLPAWAKTLRALGAIHAFNYDGGSSAGLVVRGVAVVRAARRVSTALVVARNTANRKPSASTRKPATVGYKPSASTRKPSASPPKPMPRTRNTASSTANGLGITNVR